MNILSAGTVSKPAAATTPQDPRPETNTVSAPAAQLTPAATVEISPAAHQAHAAGRGHSAGLGQHPLNIIWGNSPK